MPKDKKSTTTEVHPEDKIFVISPIDKDPNSRCNKVLKYLIMKAAENTGFKEKVERADNNKKPGSITNAIITDLFESRIVIADLTDQNPNVLYELALRHAFNKPVIHLIHESQIKDLPFDINIQRAILYDDGDIGKTEVTINEIEEAIKACLAEPTDGLYDNPVNDALKKRDRFKFPEKSEIDNNTEMKVITNMFKDISAKINHMESNLIIPTSVKPEKNKPSNARVYHEYLRHLENHIGIPFDNIVFEFGSYQKQYEKRSTYLTSSSVREYFKKEHGDEITVEIARIFRNAYKLYMDI